MIINTIFMLEKMKKKNIPAAIVIFLAIAGVVYYSKNIKPTSITEKKKEYTAEEKVKMVERIVDLQKKIAEPPKDATTVDKYSWNMQIGFQNLALEKFSEARVAFLAASKIQPDDYTVWLAFYEVDLAENDYVSAQENIKKAISLDNSNPALWKKYIELEKGKLKATPEHVEQLFSQAFSSTRSDAEIITLYAQFLEGKKDFRGAVEQWKKAIAAYPQNKDIYQAEINRLEGLIK